MQGKRIRAGCEGSPNEADDLKAQRIVLTQVLALHPTQLTIPRLVRALTTGNEDFAESDAFERAIRDLTGVGLLDCPGGIVMATPAALHADRIGVL